MNTLNIKNNFHRRRDQDGRWLISPRALSSHKSERRLQICGRKDQVT
jgi:hypothetical protein